MTKKIESLTPAQERHLVEYRDEWLAWGRSCEPADRPTAERCFHAMYAALGKQRPFIWWCDGPAVGSLVRTVLNANLGDNLGANLGANLRANLWDNLGDNLGDNLMANLGDNLMANLGANLRANLGDNLFWGFWGQHEAYWSAYYWWPHLALRSIHSEEQVQKLSWWMDLSRSCGWWNPFEGIVLACERPSIQAVDSNGRLHRSNGPALLCRDGFLVYAWHGVRVPAKVIEQPEEITVDEIASERNAEVRRVKIERYGFDRYLRDGQFVLEQHDDFGRLYRKKVDGEPDLVFVEVINSTPEPDGTKKRYVIPVRSTVRTAHEAVATSFGLERATYCPSLES